MYFINAPQLIKQHVKFLVSAWYDTGCKEGDKEVAQSKPECTVTKTQWHIRCEGRQSVKEKEDTWCLGRWSSKIEIEESGVVASIFKEHSETI